MNPPTALHLVLAGVLAAGCAFTEDRASPQPRAPGWQDTGTPPPSVVWLERKVRYYTDETGAIWDDRGRRVGAPR